MSWGDQPATHSTPAEIVRGLNIDHGALSCITAENLNWIRSVNDQDLDLCSLRNCKVQKLTDSNNKKRMIRWRKLLPKYTQKILQTAFFSDEKIFNVKQCDACFEENDESRGARGQITLRRETFVRIYFRKLFFFFWGGGGFVDIPRGFKFANWLPLDFSRGFIFANLSFINISHILIFRGLFCS